MVAGVLLHENKSKRKLRTSMLRGTRCGGAHGDHGREASHVKLDVAMSSCEVIGFENYVRTS